MPHSDVLAAQAWLAAHESELIESTRDMLRIPSLKGEALPNAPFGDENRRALDLALKMGADAGMRVKDLDGFAGYAEWGSGEKLIVILGHLDVVPVGDGWKHEPFGAEIDGEYLYSRGSTDDKGPTMAAFFASRALMEVCPNLNARIRTVFGCDEESGMKCVEHYNEVEEAPTYGIAPDSSWPLVHAEKGICDFFLTIPIADSPFQIVSAKGGYRLNVVIDSCEVVVKVSPSIKDHVISKIADSWDKNLSLTWKDSDHLVVSGIGKAAHGSRPFSGDSAATRVFRFLVDCAPIELEDFYEELLWMTHPSGVGIGIHTRDEVSFDLTSNLGIVEFEDGSLKFSINVRYPTTMKGDHIYSLCSSHLANKLKCGAFIVDFHDSPSLYFPIDSPIVSAIVGAYREETGDPTEPGVMGGGTYARKIANTVSIGTSWEGDGKAHETDERIKVAHLLRASKIYANILHRLCNL